MGFQIRELLVEHLRQSLGMALRDGEHNRLAPLGHPPEAVPAHEALLMCVAELAHQGAVAFGDRELPLQCLRVHRDRVRTGEPLLELGAGRTVHGTPVEFVPVDHEAVFGRGLHRHRPVDAIRHQMARLDGLAQAVAESGFGEFEEPQRVAHEPPVLGIGQGIGIRRAGRGRQAELEGNRSIAARRCIHRRSSGGIRR